MKLKMLKKITRLTEQILQIHKLCSEMTAFKNYYKSDLRKLKRVLELARMMKFEFNKINEYEIAGKAVRFVYTPQFSCEVKKKIELFLNNYNFFRLLRGSVVEYFRTVLKCTHNFCSFYKKFLKFYLNFG